MICAGFTSLWTRPRWCTLLRAVAMPIASRKKRPISMGAPSKPLERFAARILEQQHGAVAIALQLRAAAWPRPHLIGPSVQTRERDDRGCRTKRVSPWEGRPIQLCRHHRKPDATAGKRCGHRPPIALGTCCPCASTQSNGFTPKPPRDPMSGEEVMCCALWPHQLCHKRGVLPSVSCGASQMRREGRSGARQMAAQAPRDANRDRARAGG